MGWMGWYEELLREEQVWSGVEWRSGEQVWSGVVEACGVV